MRKSAWVVGLGVVACTGVAAFVLWRRRNGARPKREYTIRLRNEADFKRKVDAIVAGGVRNLQVIADFDRTLTRAFVGNEHCMSCHSTLVHAPGVSKRFRDVGKSLYDRFYPIEIAHDMTIQEKIPHMVKWYESNHAALLQENISPDFIADAVQHSNVELRDGCAAMVAKLQDAGVPLLIFSAGIGNLIVEIFQQKGVVLSDTTHVISNWIRFDDNGAASFEEPLIHMFNKDERHVQGTPFAQSVIDRRNAIVIGDTLGDASMAQGVEHTEVLKIGFLHEHEDKQLDKYLQVFDVVILGDGPLNIVNFLLDSATRVN